jgi:AraC family transcriptional regulator of adaptative response/methylated-DNA-[protein]-cysteine methyltransferase
MEAAGTPPLWLRPLLAAVEENPSARYPDARLRSLGLQPARVRRYFTKHFGMTFQAYCRGRRLGSSLARIRSGEDLDDAALGHGYESHSGFRSAFSRIFGAPPGQSRGADCIYTIWIETPIGPLVAGATSTGICLLEFTERKRLEAQVGRLRTRFGFAIVPGRNAHLERLEIELGEYFAGTRRGFTLPLAMDGAPFERKVWETLLTIPYGETASYQEIACRIGSPKASRAVGRANGLNRIAILIPCHRVINKSGGLGGYGGGLWRKKKLLALEKGTREE